MGRQSAGANKVITTILAIQSAITLLAAATFLLFVGSKAAYSAGVGGGISIIVMLCFARQVFSPSVGASAAKIARRFYIGEVVKIVLTAILFVIAVLWLHISFLPLFLTYAATLMAYWLVLPFTLNNLVRTR